MSIEQKLSFYATPPHSCNYLPGKNAITLFADPRFQKNTRLYSALAECGFRRSGEHLYIPHCENCSSCVPVRIPVNEFVLSRTQKRNWKKKLFISSNDFFAPHAIFYNSPQQNAAPELRSYTRKREGVTPVHT